MRLGALSHTGLVEQHKLGRVLAKVEPSSSQVPIEACLHGDTAEISRKRCEPHNPSAHAKQHMVK